MHYLIKYTFRLLVKFIIDEKILNLQSYLYFKSKLKKDQGIKDLNFVSIFFFENEDYKLI